MPRKGVQFTYHRRAPPRETADPTVDLYMRDVGRHALLTAEQERELATEISSLQVELWARILSYAPLLEAIALVARAQLEVEAGTAVDAALADACAASSALRERDTAPHRARLTEATRRLAALISGLDPESVLADALAVDLRCLATGRHAALLSVEVPSRRGRRFANHVEAVGQCASMLVRARNRFVRSNLRLVTKVAYGFHAAPVADLIQEGNLGLIKAAYRFDPARGFRFSTYAMWWVRHCMRRWITNKERTVRVPAHLHDLAYKIASVRRRLEGALEREPTDAEIAEMSGTTVSCVAHASRVLLHPVSMDAAHFTGGWKFSDQFPSVESSVLDALVAEGDRALLGPALAQLGERERDILRQRFGLDGQEPVSLVQIGKQYGLSRERIRQLEARALEQMRAAMEAM
jgi:RNA polymerase primary sigma factor